MKRLIGVLLALLLVAPVSAQSPQIRQLLLRQMPVVVSVGSCTPGTQAANFLARTSGLSGTETTAYCNLINGLVTDGIITGTMAGSGSGATACGSKLDALYIFATSSTTNANLNLCSTSYTITAVGTPTFTADRGYKAAASTDKLDTGFNPATLGSINWTQNTAHLSLWQIDNTQHNHPAVGTDVNGNTHLYPVFTDGNFYSRINDSSGSSGFAASSAAGHFLGNRDTGTGRQEYINGASAGTYGSVASSGSFNADIFFLATSNDVADTGINYAQGSIGGSLSSTDAANFYSRLRTYMTAVGVP